MVDINNLFNSIAGKETAESKRLTPEDIPYLPTRQLGTSTTPHPIHSYYSDILLPGFITFLI